MRFYTQAHRYYCGIDLHARWMYLCILDPKGRFCCIVTSAPVSVRIDTVTDSAAHRPAKVRRALSEGSRRKTISQPITSHF
jgi:hypothetical protein